MHNGQLYMQLMWMRQFLEFMNLRCQWKLKSTKISYERSRFMWKTQAWVLTSMERGYQDGLIESCYRAWVMWHPVHSAEDTRAIVAPEGVMTVAAERNRHIKSPNGKVGHLWKKQPLDPKVDPVLFTAFGERVLPTRYYMDSLDFFELYRTFLSPTIQSSDVFFFGPRRINHPKDHPAFADEKGDILRHVLRDAYRYYDDRADPRQRIDWIEEGIKHIIQMWSTIGMEDVGLHSYNWYSSERRRTVSLEEKYGYKGENNQRMLMGIPNRTGTDREYRDVVQRRENTKVPAEDLSAVSGSIHKKHVPRMLDALLPEALNYRPQSTVYSNCCWLPPAVTNKACYADPLHDPYWNILLKAVLYTYGLSILHSLFVPSEMHEFITKRLDGVFNTGVLDIVAFCDIVHQVVHEKIVVPLFVEVTLRFPQIPRGHDSMYHKASDGVLIDTVNFTSVGLGSDFSDFGSEWALPYMKVLKGIPHGIDDRHEGRLKDYRHGYAVVWRLRMGGPSLLNKPHLGCVGSGVGGVRAQLVDYQKLTEVREGLEWYRLWTPYRSKESYA